MAAEATASPRPASGAPSHRVPELDGLRGLAIALVLWCHLVEPVLPLGRATWGGWLRAGTNLSWSGVDLFFVLSGYFIGGILIDQRESPNLSRVFYLRRAVRILPLYYVTLAVCLLADRLQWLHWEYSGWGYSFFLSNIMLSLHNVWDAAPLSPLWSLAVEEQFYLAAPWVIRFITPARLPWFLGGLVATAWILRAVTSALYPEAWMAMHMLTPLRMDLLALGALLAWAMRTPAARPFFTAIGRHWGLWLGAGLVLLVALAAHYPPLGSPLLAYAGYTVLALFYALLVAIVAGVRPPLLQRVLRCAPLVSLGRYSYFVYLWHMLIGAGVFHLLKGPAQPLGSAAALLAVAAGIGATWLAALVSWRFFEGPLVALGQRHRY